VQVCWLGNGIARGQRVKFSDLNPGDCDTKCKDRRAMNWREKKHTHTHKIKATD